MRLGFVTKTTAMYAVVASAYIAFSDTALYAIVQDPDWRYTLGVWKGFGFVLFTAIALALLLRAELRRRESLHRELEAAERRWRFALEGAGHGVWEWDAVTNKVYFSHEWKAMLGYADDEIGDTLSEWESRVHPEDLPATMAAVQAHFAGRTASYESEHRVRCKDGSYKWILDRGRVIEHDPSGQPRTMIGTHTDLTARRLAERALRDSEARYRQMFEANPHPMWVYATDSLRFLAVNDAAVAQYGYGRDEFLRMTIADIRPPEDVPRLRENVAAVKDGQIDRAGLWRHRKKDGALIDVEITSHELRHDGMRAELVLALDVTERLRAERERHAAEAKFRALSEQSMSGVYMVEDGRFAYINPRGAEILGRTPAEVIGRPAMDFVDEASRAEALERGRRRAAGEDVDATSVVKVRRKDGTAVTIGAASTETLLEGRRVLVGVMQDITEKLALEEREREYVRRLELAVTGTVNAVSKMMDLRDPYTAGHEVRVGQIAAAIAGEMGLDEATREGLRIAGAVHDVGKITVPAEILSKPGRLTPAEFAIVKTHAQQGWEILRDIDSPWPLAEVARQHHERMDGSGYPRGLKGEAILREARILAVADVVESMASHRPYRPTLGLGPALEEIEKNAGRLYDPDVAAACLRLFRERGYALPD